MTDAQAVTLDDPRFSDALFESIDRRIEDAIRRTTTVEQYGTVAAIDPVTRRCSVYLNGSSTASPGFGYGSLVLTTGSRVQVRRTPTGDRYVSMVLDLTGAGADDPDALLPGSTNLVPNSSFEYATDWTVGSATVPFSPVLPDRARTGSKTARLVLAGAAATALLSAAFIPVDRSQEYWASWWTYLRSYTSGELSLNVVEFDAAGVQLAVTRLHLTAAELGYTRHAIHFGLDTSNGKVAWQPTTAQVKIGFSSNSAVSTLTADVDDVQFERSTALTAYAPQPWELLDVSVGTTKIADDSITTPKIVANAVVAGKVATDAIETRHLAIGSAGSIAPLTNGDFETGDIRGWSPTATVGTVPFVEANASVAGLTGMQGGWHVTIYKDPASTYDFIQHDVLIPVRVGDALRISALYATGTAGAQCQVQTVCCDKDGAELSYPDGIVTIAGLTATRQSVTVTIATAGTAFIKLRFFNITLSSWIFIDDIAVARAGTFANADGTIIADETGLTIKNGKLTLQDEFGSTVMSASGFAGSWNDFVQSGLLNGNFSANTDHSPVIGRTIWAPYWTTTVLAGAPVFETIPSGIMTCVLPASGASGRISSDMVPVQESGAIQVMLLERNGAAGTNSLTRVVKYEWFDWNKTSLGSSTLDTKTYTNSPSTWQIYTTNRVPVGGKYVRIHIEATWLSSAASAPFYQVSSVVLQPSPWYIDTSTIRAATSITASNTLTVGADSYLNAVYIGTPSGYDAQLTRPVGGNIKFTSNGNAVNTWFQIVATSGRQAVLSLGVSGETQERTALWGDGSLQALEFGGGGAGSRDIRLFRGGAGDLELSTNGVAATTQFHLTAIAGQRNNIEFYMAGDSAPRVHLEGSATQTALRMGPGNAADSQVLTTRRTGWTAATGTATRATFATSTVTLPVLAEHVKALIDDFITHGAIGA